MSETAADAAEPGAPAPEAPAAVAVEPILAEPVGRALLALEEGKPWSAAKPALFEAMTAAALDPVEVERVLKRASAATGATLDAMRAAWRETLAAGGADGEADNPPGRPLELAPPEPWPNAVELGEVLDAVAAAVRAHVVMEPAQADAVALWAAFAHRIASFAIAPRLAVVSPTKRCGKSTLLEVVSLLVPKPVNASSATAAALFRAIDQFAPAVLLDECDQYLKDDNDMKAVINSSHRRSGAMVLRAVKIGEEIVVRRFSTWAPMVLAGIGTLPDTIADRSVIVRLERRSRVNPIDRLDDAARDRLSTLARKLARWARNRGDRAFPAQPWLPALNDRANDNWAPLRAIAADAGGSWPARAGAAAVALSPTDSDAQSLAELLLADVQAVFAEAGDPATLPSEAICARLGEMDDRPWPEASHGKPITPRRLAALLGRFKLVPSRSKRERFWRRAELAPVWERYLRADDGSSDEPSPSASLWKRPPFKASSRHIPCEIKDLAGLQSVTTRKTGDALRVGLSPCQETKSDGMTLCGPGHIGGAGGDAFGAAPEPEPAPRPDGEWEPL
jgi:putative DNA primase/helicase